MSDSLLKRIAHLSPEQREQLLQRLNVRLEQQEPVKAQSRLPVIPVRRSDDPCFLSFAQQRLWFLDQLDGATSQYTICRAIHLKGPLRVEALTRSLHALLARHESLRTSFVQPAGQSEPVQVIAAVPAASTCLLPCVDLRSLPPAHRLDHALQLARAQVQRPFDLAQGPLYRWLLLRLDAQEHVLVLCLHHILADGWSLVVALRELSALYAHALRRTDDLAAMLPAVPVQFADYASWQRSALQGQALTDLMGYWQQQMQGAPLELELPTDHARPTQPSHRGALLTRALARQVCEPLRQRARQEDVTLFMLLLAAFGVLLVRWSGQEDLLVGTPVANRGRQETEGVIGCLVNTLVVRLQAGRARTFREVLQQVRETTLEGYAHQELPFEKLVEAVQPQRDLRRSPLFQVMFVLQNTPATPLTLPGVEAQIEIIDVEAAPFEITCSIEERGEGLEVGIQYASELFEAATIQRLLRSYETLLEQCALNPDISIWSVPLLTAQDQQHFAALWERSLPTRPLFLHKLFEEQAVQRPDALAVVSEGNALSYRELEERANGLAHRLVAQGVGPETLVGLCIQRSPEMLIGLLAILKAGGAYVPLDPVYPSERLRLMLEDACPPVVLTLERLRAHLPLSNLPSTQCVCLDVDSNGHTPAWDVPPPVALNRQNLAYVIYTSGSTGNPKGVCITHEASASFCQSMTEHYAFVSTERVLQFTSLSFDLALEEIFATLSRGATLVLWPPQENIDLIEFTHFLALQCVSVINLSSSLWNVWLDTLIRQEIQPHSALRLVITGNEPIEIERLRLWQEYVGTRLRWLHAYGVTEATVTSTFCASDMFNASAWEGPVSIGLPIYNTRIYILDAHGQPVPPGVPGELYLGGGELARGYLHHPEVTAERFLPNPFASTPGSLLYKTGDLVRYGEDGLLRYLGRDDQQVKIRGFRIELAEVERVLALHPALKEVVVAARTDLAGKKDLVAYFVSRHGQLQPYQEMLHFLQERLPAFMLPAAFVQLEQLPKLPNGKIDRQRLPEPEYSLVAEDSDALLPRTPLEDLLLNIWKDLLQLENISIQANFFALGGYSLLAAQVTSRLRRALRREIPVRLIFEYPTIAQLAAHLEMQLQEEVYGTFSPIQTLERNVAPALSFEQLRLWFLDQLEPGSALYNLPTAIHLKGPLQVEALARSLHALLARHESLRTSFVQPAGQSEPVQVIAAVPAASTCLLPCVDLRSLPPAHRMDHALQLARAQVQRPFDLAQGPLYRWLLLRLDAQEHVLVLCLHHILADGWSLVVALRELSALYAHALRRTDDLASVLPTLPVQFADYASWQRGALQGQALADLLGYWTRQLEGAPLELELPTDHARPAQPSHRGALLTCSLPQPMGEQLRRRARQEDVTLFMLLLAAFGVLLVRWSGQEDLLVGTPVANRGRQETEGVIGCLVNTLVVRLQAGRARTFREVLQQVRETTLEGYAHQELPFEKLVEAVQPQRDLRRSPLFQVMFVFQNTAPQSLDLPDVQSEFLKFSLDLAKFDLSLSVTETKTGLDLTVEYSTELFEVATVQRLLDSYQVLLEGILSQKTANWRQLPLLSIQEQRKLLVEWAQSEQSASYEVSDLPLHRLFEEQIARTPHATALVYQDQRLSFSELNQQANQLASYLSKYISHTEIPVGLCIERSPAMLIGLLAILKAGGYYVPLDPAYPQERLAFLMKDAHIALLITQQHLLAALPVLAEIQRLVICVDTDQAKIALEPTENLAREVSADNLAYSIYTSGSTGRPKGVLVPHRGVSNVIHHTLSMAVQQAGQQMLQQTSLSFDASVLEIFTSLLSGGCLHLLPPELAGSGEGLAHFIDERRIALLVITPSMLEVIPYAEYPALQTIILGGESCPVELANRWLQRYRVFNAYAPTETTIYMTQKELREPVQHALSLGRPIGHMSIYVLDPYMQPVPIGTRGELYIGGVGVTRGYHDLPALTAERFVPDPFSREPGRRLYRTGDLACYLPDGNLRFLGRDDDQIKIRGLRVELGEIEATLAQHPRVQQAIVLLEGQNAREKRLAACYVPVEGTDPAHELRPFLAQSLPSALIPGRFIAFTAFPLNPNGKIDRQTIQRMLAEQRDLFEKESIHQTPRNSVEERLAEIWQEALGIGSIGIHDNFFELGGHSLLATQIISRAREAFQTELPLRILFEAPTIAELAERIIQQEISQTEEETLALLLQQLQD